MSDQNYIDFARGFFSHQMDKDAERILEAAHDRLCLMALPDDRWDGCQQDIYRIVDELRGRDAGVIEAAVSAKINEWHAT